MGFTRCHDDGCLFMKVGRAVEVGDADVSAAAPDTKAGRHIDDFLVTGPEEQVKHFLAEAKEKLNMQEAVRQRVCDTSGV